MCYVQEPLLFYRCAFDGLEWQRSLYSHVATKSLLQSFLDAHLCSAAHLVVCCALLRLAQPKCNPYKYVMSSKTRVHTARCSLEEPSSRNAPCPCSAQGSASEGSLLYALPMQVYGLYPKGFLSAGCTGEA